MSEEILKEEESIPFYPDHVRTEFRVVIGLVVIAFILGIIGTILPVGLGAPADPMETPAHVKPEWYFLALYQMLKYMPKTLGAVTPVFLVILLMILPFIDRKPDTSKKAQRVRLIITIITVVILVVLTIWGEIS